jgi:hypothetical protein
MSSVMDASVINANFKKKCHGKQHGTLCYMYDLILPPNTEAACVLLARERF